MIIGQLFDSLDEIVSQPKMNGPRLNESGVLITIIRSGLEGVGDLASSVARLRPGERLPVNYIPHGRPPEDGICFVHGIEGKPSGLRC